MRQKKSKISDAGEGGTSKSELRSKIKKVVKILTPEKMQYFVIFTRIFHLGKSKSHFFPILENFSGFFSTFLGN